jgi:ABC-type branched-subunit amino acid transport system substrate-binding protein
MSLAKIARLRSGFAGFGKFTRTILLSGSLALVVAGCVTDRQSLGDAPRDLIGELAVKPGLGEAGTTKVGVLLPLTGPQAEIGRQLWDAAVLALFESGRDDITLVPHDTGGTALGAMKAAEKAVTDGSSAVIGPLFSTSVAGARPVLAAAGLRGVALSNNRAEARAPFFLIGNHPETQVDAIVAYLASAGRHRVKLFGPDTRYLQLIRERLVLLDKAGKIQLIDSRLYRTSASYTEIAKDVRAITLYDRRAKALKDFTAIFANAWEKFDDPEEALQNALETLASRTEQARLHYASLTPPDIALPALPERKSWAVTEKEYSEALSAFLQTYHRHLKVKVTPRDAMKEAITEFERGETLGEADFDAVLLPIGDKPLLVIAPMFAYFNATQPDVWMVGTDIWESAARQMPKDLRGGRYVMASAPAWQGFESRFEEAFGHKPDRLAAAAYDAVRVAVTEKKETGRLSLDAAFLTRPSGFEGINGTFRFLPAGDNERALQIVEVGDGAPSSVFTWLPEQESPQQPILSGGAEKIAPLPSGAPAVQPTPPISTLIGHAPKQS